MKVIICTVITLILLLNSCSKSSSSKGDVVYQSVFDTLESEERIEPIRIPLEKPIKKIFSIPKANSIGTIDLKNGITALQFEKDRFSVKMIKRNFTRVVSGPSKYTFIPTYSDDEIAYSMGNVVIFQNIHTKENRGVIMFKSMDDYLGKIAPLNPDENIFAVQRDKPYYGIGARKEIHVGNMDLKTNEEFKSSWSAPGGIKSHGYDGPWFCFDKKLFVYDDVKGKLNVYSHRGEESTHVIKEIIERNTDVLKLITGIIPHPNLPFAIVLSRGFHPEKELEEYKRLHKEKKISIEEKSKLSSKILGERRAVSVYVLCWDKGTASELVPIFTPGENRNDFPESLTNIVSAEFSRDGSVLVMRNRFKVKDLYLIALPVSESFSGFLGKVHIMETGVRYIEENSVRFRGSAWVENPTAYVMSDGEEFYKWDFEKSE